MIVQSNLGWQINLPSSEFPGGSPEGSNGFFLIKKTVEPPLSHSPQLGVASKEFEGF